MKGLTQLAIQNVRARDIVIRISQRIQQTIYTKNCPKYYFLL
jgi:hypothetical protein